MYVYLCVCVRARVRVCEYLITVYPIFCGYSSADQTISHA